jgi:hypothetical protein
MINRIDECFLDSSNSNKCLGNNSEEKLLEMIRTLYKLIEEKEKIYTIHKTYDKNDLIKIKIYIKNLLRHVKFYINQDQEKAAAEVAQKTAETERLKKAEEELKEANEKLKKTNEELEKAKEAAAEDAQKTEEETEKLKKAVEDAQNAKAAAEAAAKAAQKELEKLKIEANTAAKAAEAAAEEADAQKAKKKERLAAEAEAAETAADRLAAETEAAQKKASSPASSAQSSSQSSSQSSPSASPQSSSQPQLKSANSITGLKLLENTDTNKNNNNKFIINLIKILNFGFENKITNNNTKNQNFNEKINNIVQQNNNIINALYNDEKNTTDNEKNTTDIVFSSENIIVKPLFLTDGTIYNKNSNKINKYYTPLFGIDGNNFFKSITKSEQNNKLDNYKLILFMIKFDYIGLNKYHNIYTDNDIKPIDYLDKTYHTLNNNKFLKIIDNNNNIYKINKKYYYDYTSDNIQKHIVKNVVVK